MLEEEFRKVVNSAFTVSEAAKSGVSRAQLADWAKTGLVERMGRGIYRFSDDVGNTQPEIEILVKRGTKFRIALQSALRLHDFTTALPSSVWIALPRGCRRESARGASQKAVRRGRTHGGGRDRPCRESCHTVSGGGSRMKNVAHIGQTRTTAQIDVGVGDAVTPAARRAKFPTLLDFPAPELRMYPPETAVAEKFETMVKRGMVNSRMKDFNDIWKIRSLLNLDAPTLKTAIARTFERRKRNIPVECPVALTERFAHDALKQKQWKAFLRKSRLSVGDKSFADIIRDISDFLMAAIGD